MISKAAADTSAHLNNLVFTKAARDAWGRILGSIKSREGYTNILLPAYIGFTEREGSGIFDPVESTQSEYSFYELNEDLSINMQSLETLMQAETFNVLLVVHYFGFCRNDLVKIKALCEEYGIYIVEDCAHAFHLWTSPETLGVTGDFSFYSVHKYLPVEDGGILRVITDKASLLDVPSADETSQDVALQLLKSDYDSIRAIRRQNFALYAESLADVPGLEIMYQLTENDIPQTFPVRVKQKKREPLYFYLMEKDMPTTALYYRLIDKLSPEAYPLSHAISGEILNLPLHQDVTAEDIQRLTTEIKLFLGANK